MNELKFKTNVNCGHCIAKITPFMDGEKAVSEWSVDTDNPDKIMTVKGENVTGKVIIETLGKAGYTAELLTD
jgi:copper chaperone